MRRRRNSGAVRRKAQGTKSVCDLGSCLRAYCIPFGMVCQLTVILHLTQ